MAGDAGAMQTELQTACRPTSANAVNCLRLKRLRGEKQGSSFAMDRELGNGGGEDLVFSCAKRPPAGRLGRIQASVARIIPPKKATEFSGQAGTSQPPRAGNFTKKPAQEGAAACRQRSLVGCNDDTTSRRSTRCHLMMGYPSFGC